MLFSNLNFVFLQLWTWCISNCSHCLRSRQQYGMWSIIDIKSNIDKLTTVFNENLLIYNIDYFDLPEDLINYVLHKRFFFKKIYFHTNFRSFNSLKVKNKINFLYQRDLSNSEIIFITKFLLTNKMENKITFVLWYDNPNYKIKLIKVLSKYFKLNYQENNRSFYIWKSEFMIYNKDWERQKLTQCFFKDSINIINSNVVFGKNFFISCLEVLLNWDIRVHEPPCWFWNLVVSNIYFKSSILLNDFSRFWLYIKKFLNKNENLTQQSICSKCNKESYVYEK